MKLHKIKNQLTNINTILTIYMLIVLVASLYSYYREPKIIDGIITTKYNNYLIFKQSFYHLINNKDLYTLYPKEHWDHFKYSPTFPVLMSFLSVQPDLSGLILWNLINSLVLFIAIKKIPYLKERTNIFILWFVLKELLTCIQNNQSNGLIAGLLILSFVYLEKRNYILATLFVVLSFYIKIFGIVAFSLFLLYPNKSKYISYSIMWVIILGVLPLFFVSPMQLKFLYTSWLNLLSNDYSVSYGLSVMGWLYTWFNIELNKYIILLIGIILFCIPLLRIPSHNNYGFRLLFLSSVLIWIIIFNHKAESPTFIIAICGVALWYFPQVRKTENLIIVIIAFILTSMSSSDLFPKYLKEEFVKPYVLKVVPCIFIWFKITYELIFNKYKLKTETELKSSASVQPYI